MTHLHESFDPAVIAAERDMLVEQNRRLLWLIANLEPLCVNADDGAPFEDGEVPYVDEARTLTRRRTP